MPLIKNNQITEDVWITLADDTPIPAGKDVIVSLVRWQEERSALQAHDGRVGVRLQSDQSPAIIQADLQHLDVVALEFPAYKDGRAYSYARLLRDRYGYEGEVRAVGDVLRDQAFYMQRCGFDAFEVVREGTLDGWLDALAEFSVVYQPATDQRPFVINQRHVAAQAAE